MASVAFAEPPNAAQWVQTFDASFSGKTLDPQIWKTEYVYGGRADTELYVIEDGKLKLRLEKGLPTGTVSHADTWRSFAQKYGWFEMRGKTARPTVGTHAAFWLIPWDRRYNDLTRSGVNGSRSNFDEAFEIDIFELPGINPRGGLFTIDWGRNEPRSINNVSFRKNFGALDLSQGFHNYAFNWEPSRAVWYLDGQEILRVDGHSPSVPFYIMLDHYAGAWVPMDPHAQYPLDFEIEWVKAYQKKEHIVSPPDITACDGFLEGYEGTPIHVDLDKNSMVPQGKFTIRPTDSSADPKSTFFFSVQKTQNESRPAGFSEVLSARGSYSTSNRTGNFVSRLDSNMLAIVFEGGTTPPRSLRLICR
jgi:beta-glucanase (GH16 family)